VESHARCKPDSHYAALTGIRFCRIPSLDSPNQADARSTRPGGFRAGHPNRCAFTEKFRIEAQAKNTYGCHELTPLLELVN
jgi:hypothetical protein